MRLRCDDGHREEGDGRQDRHRLPIGHGLGADRVRQHVRGGRTGDPGRLHRHRCAAVQHGLDHRTQVGGGPVTMAPRPDAVSGRQVHRRRGGLPPVHRAGGHPVCRGDPRGFRRQGRGRVHDGGPPRHVRALRLGRVLQMRLGVRLAVVPRLLRVRGVVTLHQGSEGGVPVGRRQGVPCQEPSHAHDGGMCQIDRRGAEVPWCGVRVRAQPREPFPGCGGQDGQGDGMDPGETIRGGEAR